MRWDAYLAFKTAGILTFVFAGAFYAHKKQNLPLMKCLVVTALVAAAGFAASRFWFIAQYALGSEPYDPKDLLEAWNEAGSVLYGWIIGGTAALILLTNLFKINTVRFLDRVVPWMLLAQMLNRFGCFAGECCWGRPTDLFLRVWNSHEKAMVHPVQLYEAAFDGLLFYFVLRRQKRAGEASFLYYTGYAAGRFLLEFLRGDNHAAFLGLTVPQITSVFVLLAVFLLWKTPEVKNQLS